MAEAEEWFTRVSAPAYVLDDVTLVAPILLVQLLVLQPLALTLLDVAVAALGGDPSRLAERGIPSGDAALVAAAGCRRRPSQVSGTGQRDAPVGAEAPMGNATPILSPRHARR